jgi:hypothetical protein
VSGGWNCGTSYLNFETESYASSTGAINDWINVPSMSAGQTLYACYGAAAVNTDQSNPNSTWNSTYAAIYHFPNGTTLNTDDSTANVNNGTNNGATATSGQIDGAANFNGTSQYVTISKSLGYGDTATTYSMWVYIQSTSEAGTFLDDGAQTSGSGETNGMGIGVGSADLSTAGNDLLIPFWAVSWQNTGVALGTGWKAITVVRTLSNTAKAYLNGNLVYTGSFVMNGYVNTITSIAAETNMTSPRYFPGSIDEVRVANVALSPSWILTEYNNQSSPSTFYAIGSEQTNGSSVPSLSNLVFNGATSITLIPNATMSVSVVASTTDTGGAGNIAYATSTIYRTSLGQNCAANNANCYKLPSSSCVFSGSTSTVTCTAGLWYFAQSTGNASSSFPSDSWSVAITLADNAGATTTATSSAVNVNVLTAINITTSSINYGTLIPNTNTGSTNQTVTVQNVGNSSTTLQLSGTAFVNGGNTIATSSQHYASSTFTFGGSEPQLSDTLTTVSGFILTGPVSTSSVQGNIYWGDAVPSGSTKGNYTATTTFSAAFSQ